MLNELIKDTKKRIKNLETTKQDVERMGLNVGKGYEKTISISKDLLQCLKYLKLFITNAQVIKTDKEQIVEVVSTIKDQKVLVDLIRFIIKEVV